MGITYINVRNTKRKDSDYIIFNISLRFTRTKKCCSLMLETTGLCPFHETCETRRDLMRFEKRLLKERREFYSDASYFERVEYNTFMSDYQRSFLSITRIQERCSSNHKRCLRFWQRLSLENKVEMRGQHAPDWITLVITE